MRSETFRAESLIALFRRRQVTTMQEMKAALGTTVDMTVFRKLRELTYCSSYSHRGKFYTLEALAEFDERGLWASRGCPLLTLRVAPGHRGAVRRAIGSRLPRLRARG